MNIERYTNKVKTAIQNAQMKALANDNIQEGMELKVCCCEGIAMNHQ